MSRDTWRTPAPVFKWASNLVAGFTYDAACEEANALATPLWSREEFTTGDSLSAAWPDTCTIWCNPPYSRVDPWIDRALKTRARVAMLIPSPNGEERYWDLLPHVHEIHIIGRIAFIDEAGKPKAGNERGSSLFLFNTWGAGSRSLITREEVFSLGKLGRGEHP